MEGTTPHPKIKKSSYKKVEVMLDFKQRRHEEELMDLPETSREEFTRALYEIQWVNKNLGGISAIDNTLWEMIPDGFQGTIRILDLGTGSADIPLALAKGIRSLKAEYDPGQWTIEFQITAIDLHSTAVEVAKELTADYPEITVRQGDALNLEYADQSFDFVISSLTMHHLEGDGPQRLLSEMNRLSRIGFIVNDLERHPLAWLAIKAVSFLTGKGKVFANDAPLSVLRGFTRPELEDLCRQAGLSASGTKVEIRHRAPYRWLLIGRKR